MGCGARRLVIAHLVAMPTYCREGAVVEAAQYLEGRGAPQGHAVRLGAKPSARLCCPTEKPPTDAAEDIIPAL